MAGPDKEIGVTTRRVSKDSIRASEKDVSEAELAVKKPHHDLSSAIWAIVTGVALPCIPVLLVSAILLYFIFHYRIEIQPGWPELDVPINFTASHHNAIETFSDIKHTGGKPAYYVLYNPSTITTIASWTGRVIPYLSSSIMALVAFFAARKIVTKSSNTDGTELPTPEQLTLLIGLLGGSGFGPLKDTIFYRWARKERLVDPVPFAFYALLLVTAVGVTIPIVDTWFGIATTPAIITQLYNTTVEQYSTFGRALSQAVCSGEPGSFAGYGGFEWLPCNVAMWYGHPSLLLTYTQGASEVVALSQGVSSLNTVSNYTDTDGKEFFYLADPGVSAHLDFKAKTFAVSTTCKPITSKCQHGATWPSPAAQLVNDTISQYHFSCSPGFKANFTFSGTSQSIDESAADGGANQQFGMPFVGMAFAPDASLSSMIGTYNAYLNNNITAQLAEDIPGPNPGSNWSYAYVEPRNPQYAAIWATGFPTYSPAAIPTPPLFNDPEIYYDSANTYWILGCEAAIYDVEYTWVNGTIYTFNATLSSPEMGTMLSGPSAFGLGPASVALTAAANLASVQNTSTALADSYALSWSKAAISMTIGAMEFAPNEIEQLRNSTVKVARVPLIPLYLLLGVKALYVVAVIILAIGAYCFTHPAESEMVKAQLSAKGLAAAHFNTPDLVQQNVVKEIQKRMQKSKSTTDLPATVEEREAQEQAEMDAQKLRKASTMPASSSGAAGEEQTATKSKVALVPDAQGMWKFAVVADGIWKSIKPIAVNLVEMDASAGGLGVAGEAINAWTK